MFRILVSQCCLAAIAISILSVPVTHAESAKMQFVEVDPQNRLAFRHRDSQKPFVMVGINYFDHKTGWAPKHWQNFDAERVRSQLTMVRDAGFNTIRVFLTQKSFHSTPGRINQQGERKFRQLLEICRDLGLYLMPSGPDHWEGVPEWRQGDPFADEAILEAEARWWRAFAGRFKNDPVIIAWDLINEPTVKWDTEPMRARWSNWLAKKYKSIDAVAQAWVCDNKDVGEWGKIEPPAKEAKRNDPRLLDYQHFREDIGHAWVKRHVEAIRSADPNHMVTVGHIQWSVPIYLPSVAHYAGFDLEKHAELVDFVTVHFYPALPPMPFEGPQGMHANACYLESLIMHATTDKPLIIGEFGWYGGGELRVNGKVQLPDRPESHQLEWCNHVLNIGQGRVAGWLNWAFADTPTSGDLTRWSGIWTEDLEIKPWGKRFSEFASTAADKTFVPQPFPKSMKELKLDRSALLTDPAYGREMLHKLAEQMQPGSAAAADK